MVKKNERFYDLIYDGVLKSSHRTNKEAVTYGRETQKKDLSLKGESKCFCVKHKKNGLQHEEFGSRKDMIW